MKKVNSAKFVRRLAHCLFLIFLSIVSVRAQSGDLQRGKELFAAKNYVAAVAAFDQCAAAENSKIKTECLQMRGKARQRNGDKTKAAEDFRAVLKLDAADGKAAEDLKNLDLTVEEVSKKAEILANSSEPAKVLELLADFPEFAENRELWYFYAVSYTETHEYRTADVYYQKQFDAFVKDAAESIASADEQSAAPVTALRRETALLLYSTALSSFATANLINSLRVVASEKNGLPLDKLNPKNLKGYDEFKVEYARIALLTADLNAKSSQNAEALDNYGKALELNPKNAAAYAGRAKVYRKLKN